MSSEKGLSHELQVGAHYDELDGIYRQIWGEGLHHGLWVDGVSTATEATERMTDFIGRSLRLRTGERLMDVGCGYGRMAADLAGQVGAEAAGMTISRRQWEQAVPGVDVQLGDWLENDLPDASCDAILAIESLEHMSDPGRAVAEMARVLKPGGRLVLGCWMNCDRPSDWERRFLIDPIRKDGLLFGLSDERSVRRWLDAAGLELIGTDDLSRQVERTWSNCFWRALRLAVSDGNMRSMICSDLRRNARMALTIKRIWVAYALGAMRYVVFSARRTGFEA
ncbi:SAM-dependent methyltransferase [Haloferula sp.]|uniref:SAM-dependent methyltransferase n=1 Tax=Haloferula sp. TaxID=2497595 RepID=UPI00329CBD69